MKLSFSERDEFGNGRGVIISLPSTVTPRQILAIGRCYEKIGWQPSRRTKRALDAAKAAIKLARSTNRRASNAKPFGGSPRKAKS